MDIQTFFDHSKNGNLLDGFFHEFLLAFAILAIFGLIGLFFGWLLWRKCKRRCVEIEAENARLRAKQKTV